MIKISVNKIVSVKMKVPLSQKLTMHILDQTDNKENYSHNHMSLLNNSTYKARDQIINARRTNAKRMQEADQLKNQQINSLKQLHQKEKADIIQNYLHIVQQKEEYIKILEELYSHDKTGQQSNQASSQKPNYQQQSSKQKERVLYMHQAPLYNELCYTIKRPHQKKTNFFCTQEIRNNSRSSGKANEKSMEFSNNVYKMRRNSGSQSGSLSKHILSPACPVLPNIEGYFDNLETDQVIIISTEIRWKRVQVKYVREVGALIKRNVNCSCQKQINKTSVVLRGKGNETIQQCFSQRVEWIGMSVDYEMMSGKQIAEEYGKLRKQLNNLNAEVARAIQKVSLKSIRKQRMTEVDPTRTLELHDKEIENNEAILSRIRKEYFQLQKRATTISVGDSKLSLDEQIQAARKQCEKIKCKIKEIKLKNKSIGENITNTDNIYEEIHRLETEKDVSLKRKLKLHNKNEHVIQQISAFQLKLQEISDDCAIAENYFEQYDNKIQQSEKKKELQQKLRQVKHNFEIMSKKNEILSNTKQQKYHATLKIFQNQMQRLDLVQQKISSLQLQTIHCKKVIQDYENILKQNAQRREQFQTIQERPKYYTQVKQNTSNSLCQNQETKNTENPSSESKYEEYSHQNNHSKLVKGEASVKGGDQQEKQQQNEKEKIELAESRADQTQNGIEIKGETNKQIDPEEQEDIIMQLDEKFNSSPKNLRRSRYNDRQTQLGEEMAEDSVIDDDDEISEFKNKVKEEQWKRNSKEELAMHMSELNSQLESVNMIRSKKKEFGEMQMLK